MAKFSMTEALNQVREQDNKDHEISMARGELEAIADKANQLKEYASGDTPFIIRYGKDKIAKAMAIAVKSDGQYSKAAREIEKLSKGLSNDPSVLSALQKANEDIEWVEENKISDIFKSNKEGNSIEDIAKRLKLSVKMVKRLLGEAQEEPKEEKDDKDDKEKSA